MNFKEKLDKTLRELYKNKLDEQSLSYVLKAGEIPFESGEIEIIADRLIDLNLIKGGMAGSLMLVFLTAEGIEYCESDSFTAPGTPIINNIITNSPGASISLRDVNIQSTVKYSEAKELAEVIKTMLAKSSADQDIISEIGKCMDDLLTEVKQGSKPSLVTLRGLLSFGADMTTIEPKISKFVSLIKDLIP